MRFEWVCGSCTKRLVKRRVFFEERCCDGATMANDGFIDALYLVAIYLP